MPCLPDKLLIVRLVPLQSHDRRTSAGIGRLSMGRRLDVIAPSRTGEDSFGLPRR